MVAVMSKVTAARKLASAAAYGGGGLSLLGAGLYGVLTAEAKFARYLIGEAKDTPPDPTGWYGRGRPGPGIRLALLGDSSAAGYGVDSVEETTGAVLASGVAPASRPAGAPALVRQGRCSFGRPRRAGGSRTDDPPPTWWSSSSAPTT
jgi:hypothetical protein